MLPIQVAVKECGGQARLGQILGITQGSISQYSTGRRPVPPRLCADIEAATNCKVTREQLRPDVFKPITTEIPPIEIVNVTLSPLNIKALEFRYPKLDRESALKRLIAERKEMRIEINVKG